MNGLTLAAVSGIEAAIRQYRRRRFRQMLHSLFPLGMALKLSGKECTSVAGMVCARARNQSRLLLGSAAPHIVSLHLLNTDAAVGHREVSGQATRPSNA